MESNSYAKYLCLSVIRPPLYVVVVVPTLFPFTDPSLFHTVHHHYAARFVLLVLEDGPLGNQQLVLRSVLVPADDLYVELLFDLGA